MVTVEIWSDVVCPWCYIGKRRFEAAAARFEGEIDVVWRSFELDPSAPAVRAHTATEHLAAKYGMSVEQAEASHARMTEMAAQEGLEIWSDTWNGFERYCQQNRLAELRGFVGRASRREYTDRLSSGGLG